MADFTIKRNDWGAAEPLRARLTQLAVNAETGEQEFDQKGNAIFKPIDLTAAEAVRLILKSNSLSITTDPIEVTGPEEGAIEYQFKEAEGEDPADLGSAGTYSVEFEITWPDGLQTVPNDGYLTLEVVEDLGP